MAKWILKKNKTHYEKQYKEWMEKPISILFLPYKRQKEKNTQKESNLAESTAIADATRFIVTFRVLLWKSRGTAITRKDVVSRKNKINHFSKDNVIRKCYF